MGITQSNDYDIRYTRITDTPSLREWLKSERMLHWYPPSTEAELENFINIWIGFSQYQAGLTATFKGEPIGMGVLHLMPYKKVAHQCMFQIIVPENRQRQGVGKSLVRNLIHLSQTRFRCHLIHAEILDHSGLVPLLESLGFRRFAYQEKYVKEGDRYFPRILMEKLLK